MLSTRLNKRFTSWCKQILLLTLLSFFVSSTLFAEDIRFNVSINGYPPYMIVEKDKHPSGIIIDIVQHIAAKLNHKLVYLEVPRKRVDPMILDGKLDATARAIEWTKDPERFVFTDPIITMRDVIFSLPSNPVQFDSHEDLIGTNLRAHIGYHYRNLEPFFRDGRIYRYDDRHEDQMLKIVMNSGGRFDGAIVDEAVGLWLIKNNGWDNKFVVSENDIDMVDYRIMFNSRFRGFVDAFNLELAKLKQSKAFSDIIEKYTKPE